MKWLYGFFDWLKLLMGRFMSMKPGGSAAGNFQSKTIVQIKKECDLDMELHEIPESIIYRVIDSNGNELIKSSSLKEIFHWLEQNALKYKLG